MGEENPAAVRFYNNGGHCYRYGIRYKHRVWVPEVDNLRAKLITALGQPSDAKMWVILR